MRIIGGTHGGRKLNPPQNIPARPTTDLAKEGLFNILQNYLDFEEITALELFGGTGNITFELASRGAVANTILEKDRKSIQFIKETAAVFKFDTIQVYQLDVFKWLENTQETFDFIFADPPYALPQMDILPNLILDKNMLKPEGILVLEHTTRNNFEKHERCFRTKNYGTSIFSFFQ